MSFIHAAVSRFETKLTSVSEVIDVLKTSQITNEPMFLAFYGGEQAKIELSPCGDALIYQGSGVFVTDSNFEPVYVFKKDPLADLILEFN